MQMSCYAALNGDRSDIFSQILTKQAWICSSVTKLDVFVSCNEKSDQHSFHQLMIELI